MSSSTPTTSASAMTQRPGQSTLDQPVNPPKQTDKTLPDVQASADAREVAIQKVGVKGIRYPITLRTPGTPPAPGQLGEDAGTQSTVATVNMYVSLPHYQKGTHMSRFLEILNRHHRCLSSDNMTDVARDIQTRLEAEDAHLELAFPYFIDKKAPVTDQPGKLDIDVTFDVHATDEDDFIMGIKVPATSLCPCSKEISAYGAHNQRCEMTVNVRLKPGTNMWIEELFELVEQCASTQVFSVLKRPDEKWVTERAYENPKFVEDIVRDLAVALNQEDRVVWYQCFSENFESIHSHNAYAFVENDKRD